MKRKCQFGMNTQAMRYAALMKIIPFASERLRFNALVLAFEAGWRAARSAARREHREKDEHGT